MLSRFPEVCVDQHGLLPGLGHRYSQVAGNGRLAVTSIGAGNLDHLMTLAMGAEIERRSDAAKCLRLARSRLMKGVKQGVENRAVGSAELRDAADGREGRNMYHERQ